MADRRPLASRNTATATRAASWLALRGVSPNRISQASIVFAMLAGAAFWVSGEVTGATRVLALVVAALGCQFRLLCNLLDGMVAIEGGKATPDGAFWNEAPDRLSDAAILVGLGLGAGAPVLGWAAAALAISTAYVRELGATMGQAPNFSGIMAKPQRMALTTGAALISAVLPSLFGIDVLLIALWLLVAGTAVTVVTRSLHILRTASNDGS